MPKGFASNARMTFLALCIFALFGVVPVRFVWLHVIESDQRVAKAFNNRRQYYDEFSRRGDIIDSHGDTLATSRSLVQVAVDPVAYSAYFENLRKIKNPRNAQNEIARESAKWAGLAEILGMPRAEISRICSLKTRLAPKKDASGAPTSELVGEENKFEWINRAGVPEDIYRAIAALDIKSGIILPRIYERTYPHNQLAAHLIGFVNKEQKPVAGAESFFDCYLKPYDGWRESEKDARRRELVQFRSREVAPVEGYTVRLTIDSVIQTWAEEELASIAARYTPLRATIIISDAQSGALLALANHPTFNPNEYGKATDREFLNFAIQSYIDPGSTFKIVAASGALNDRLVTPDTRFDCSAEIAEYKGRNLRLMTDEHRWDHPLTVSEIISHSSNSGAALLAMRLGDRRFHDYIRAFGFGARTGAFPQNIEIFGSINPVEKWHPIDITRIAAGYSIGATPLQIHCAMAAIANGGELVTPQIISEVCKPDGEPAMRFGREVRRRVITPDTARTMRALLQRVVSDDGTAGKIALPGYEFAGKTGTAQKLIDGRYSDKNHIGSFSGFFPASAPRVVITVIVDDGNMPADRAAYGGAIAAPSFRHLAEKLIPYLNIKPIPAPAMPALLRPDTAVATSRQ
ncbi:MAG: penicillin-binding protein 2 [Opitutaceae bacterium]|jgi:cell division protein FtsI (penicillin-binding protein 3)/stage V sporulation protein D (sporulation-specific penicillin-binding protein)|nr:penicillin-binding protein 2 [Opitutaceae bacterium]